jgi:hypothetical protein
MACCSILLFVVFFVFFVFFVSFVVQSFAARAGPPAQH